MQNKIFLGGTTCANATRANATWREQIKNNVNDWIYYFDPVVDDWTPEYRKIEEQQKELCNVHLYVITSDMKGVFSIAEAVDSVNSDKLTILHVLSEGFEESELRSLNAVCDLIRNRGGIAYTDNDLMRSVRVLNNCLS